MKSDDLSSFLDSLEDWLFSQIPNAQGLPYRVYETMERVSHELMDTLNIQGASSISIPFPPFTGKETPPPPPPPVHSIKRIPCGLYNRAGHFVKTHPYIVGTGAALVMGVGIGIGAAALGYGGKYGKALRERSKFGTRGVVQDGMLKEAIVILAPSPMPPILWVLTVTLLRAGYVVLVVVPHVDDAEALEKRMGALQEKSALRVLIYDPEDSTTFPPFHRSLQATLTLRFPSHQASSDPYNPHPDHVPHIHAFISLYPMNPSPPTQPGALPALPTLLSPDSTGRTPLLVTLYPSGSVLVQPDAFASQVLTTNHRLLGKNLAAASSARVISVSVGNLDLPPLPQMLNLLRIYRATLTERWKNAKTFKDKLFVSRLAITQYVKGIWSSITDKTIGSKDYRHFERRILSILKSSFGTRYAVGQVPSAPKILAKFVPPSFLPRLLPVLPEIPGPTGPLSSSVQGLPAPRKQLVSKQEKSEGSRSSTPKSATGLGTTSESSSDHESGEDLASSLHSLRSTQSNRTTESSTSGTGLSESWTHLGE